MLLAWFNDEILNWLWNLLEFQAPILWYCFASQNNTGGIIQSPLHHQLHVVSLWSYSLEALLKFKFPASHDSSFLIYFSHKPLIDDLVSQKHESPGPHSSWWSMHRKCLLMVIYNGKTDRNGETSYHTGVIHMVNIWQASRKYLLIFIQPHHVLQKKIK